MYDMAGLQPNETADKTDTQPDERNDDEHQDEGIVSNRADECRDPGHGRCDQRSHIGKDSSQSHYLLPTYELSYG